MIFGKIDNLKEEIALYPEAIQKGLKYLQENDLAKMELGKYPIEGEEIFAMINAYDTEPKAVRRLESHKKYIDIQCIVEGSEMIGSGPLKDGGAITEDRFKENDVAFYADVKDETELILTAGKFAIYFPWDLHRPNCSSGKDAKKIKKAIIKISMAALKK